MQQQQNILKCSFQEEYEMQQTPTNFSKKKDNNNNSFYIFYLQLYGVGQMVKDYSGGKRGNPLLSLHRLLFPISNKGSFTVHDSTYHGIGYIRWMEKNCSTEGRKYFI